MLTTAISASQRNKIDIGAGWGRSNQMSAPSPRLFAKVKIEK
jgi:hypothetical protein